jgi:hypothetical protein
MRPKVLILLLPILFVLAVSGCTIPGLGPIFNGGTTIDYTNDIIIIKSLQLVPGNKIKAGQTLTLYADIENLQDPEKVGSSADVPVDIELYDYCTNLFDVSETKKTEDMSPKEIQTFSWTLTPDPEIKLITPCELKVKVTYKHTTRTITSITFIDADELASRIRRGESWQIGDSTTRGYGPVKAFLDVETQQPVPSDTDAQISIIIKNVGQGYIKNSELDKNQIDLKGLKADGELNPIECDYKSDEDIVKIVRKETTPLFCKIEKKDVDIEQTYDMGVVVNDYEYEFRKSINVQVEPR